MSLMKSLNSGISGLRAFQTKMDVIGNNIANVDTTGFKSSRITFSEMLSQQISSGQGSQSSPQSGAQVGLGVRISAISRDFAQGGLQSTGQNTDIALEGQGFFMLNEGGQSYLSRAGNFTFNKDGFFVDQSGRMVQGFNADAAGNIMSGGATDNIRVDFDNILEPRATKNVFVAGNLNAETSTSQTVQSQSALTTAGGAIATGTTLLNDLSQTSSAFVSGDEIEFNIKLNDGTDQTVTHTMGNPPDDTVNDLVATLNAALGGEASASLVDGILMFRSEELGASELGVNSVAMGGGNTGAITLPGFQVAQSGETASQTVSTTIYDELGAAHNLVIKLTQTEVNNWEYEVGFLDGEQVTSGASGTLEFDESGNLISGNSFSIAFDPGGGTGNSVFEVSLGNPEIGSKISQFSGSSSARITSQDGYVEGRLTDFNFDGDGFLNGVYSNGQNMQLAQLAVADVPNYEGLESLGNGLYSSTVASGDININTADNISDTSLASGVLEGSNVDLAREFTDMITSQRAYQSNARVITTADELLSEAVNLKR